MLSLGEERASGYIGAKALAETLGDRPVALLRGHGKRAHLPRARTRISWLEGSTAGTTWASVNLAQASVTAPCLHSEPMPLGVGFK
jgi:hypothetical protein